jgi:hypothetical protein
MEDVMVFVQTQLPFVHVAPAAQAAAAPHW